jgi:hypothetical protein
LGFFLSFSGVGVVPRLRDSSTAPEVALRRAGKRTIREKLFRDQRGKCCYCGCQMVLRYGTPTPANACTLEHTIPKGHFMRGKRQVYKAACFKCNNEQGRLSDPVQRAAIEQEKRTETRFRLMFRRSTAVATDSLGSEGVNKADAAIQNSASDASY